MRFSYESPIVQSGVAVATQLTFSETMTELGLAYHDPQHRIVRRVRKADLEVDSVLFGMGSGPLQGIVIWQVRDLQGFEERADASGT